ncbi:MAG: hypothetical protein KUF82_20625 [Candidatus Thiodiazotropha sp. (ex Ctena orbiculata)]|nr:hypothetical protein [Candidatus Thiodiazotropha taylori]
MRGNSKNCETSVEASENRNGSTLNENEKVPCHYGAERSENRDDLESETDGENAYLVCDKNEIYGLD